VSSAYGTQRWWDVLRSIPSDDRVQRVECPAEEATEDSGLDVRDKDVQGREASHQRLDSRERNEESDVENQGEESQREDVRSLEEPFPNAGLHALSILQKGLEKLASIFIALVLRLSEGFLSPGDGVAHTSEAHAGGITEVGEYDEWNEPGGYDEGEPPQIEVWYADHGRGPPVFDREPSCAGAVTRSRGG